MCVPPFSSFFPRPSDPLPLRSDVLPLSPTPPANLSSLVNRCRQIYFNARLGTIARPEFLLRGDGLARSYNEVYKVTVDHWSLLSGLLGEVRRLFPFASTRSDRF